MKLVKEDGEALARFRSLLSNKFPNSFQESEANDDFEMTYAVDQEAMPFGDDDDDEDAPVIVALEEVEASLSRSSGMAKDILSLEPEIRKSYPLLAAAIMPNEDVLMTCARALDEQADVSLVREAAAYLENVEQKK